MIKSKFQMLDNSVKEFMIQQKERMSPTVNYKINMNMSFKILKIEEEKEKKRALVELTEIIKVQNNEKDVAIINCIMNGIFEVNSSISRDDFVKMLNLNGVAVLLQFSRTYIYSATSLGGMPPINIPLIDFTNNDNIKS